MSAASDDLKLFHELCGLFASDPHLCEVGIVVAEDAAPFVLAEHRLGIAVRCIAPLLRAASASASQDDATRVQLLLNGDNGSAWALRRKLCVDTSAAAAKDELRLSSLALTRHPKAGEAFAMRRWVFGQSFGGELFDASAEFTLCERCAERYPSNYLAWEHRLWTLQRALLSAGASPLPSAAGVVQEQLAWSEVWVRRHVADHAGVHYRGALLLRCLDVLECGESAVRVWVEEFALLRNLVRVFPGHEALWMHFRFLCHFWCSRVRRLCHSATTAAEEKEEEEEEIPLQTALLRGRKLPLPSLSGMLGFIDSVAKDTGAWNYARQKHLSERLRGWLELEGLLRSGDVWK